jgi:hypothetical protein
MFIFNPINLNPHKFPVDIVTEDNLKFLASKLTLFLADYLYPIIVNSGLRDMALQIKIDAPNPPKKSCHLVGLAADIHDEDNRLLEFVISHLNLARELELFFENPNWTKTWIHCQAVSPKSGHRFFIPDSSPAKCNRWSGEYDHKYDFPWTQSFPTI